MRPFRFLPVLAIFCILNIFSFAFAATPQEPAFRKAAFKANYPWREGFSLSLDANAAQCKAKYGGSWRAKCAATLGRPGDTVKGVKLTPAAEGYWQWDSGMNMRFVPKNGESIKPDTTYTVDLSGLYRPDYVILDQNTLKLRTLPLSARLLGLDFWVDPSPAAKHRLAGSFEFNYPVKTENIELLAPSGAAFGKPEMVWNADRDRLNVSWIAKKLPVDPSQVRVILKNTAQIALEDGQIRFWPTPKEAKGAIFRASLPGQNQLFSVKRAELKEELDSGLNRRAVLELETSLYATPRDVLKNLELFELPRFSSPGATQPWNWENAPEIPADVLKSSRRLEPGTRDDGNGARSSFRFDLDVRSGRYVLILIKSELPSVSGLRLSSPWRKVCRAPDAEPAISFLQPGHILPLAGGGRLELYGRDIDTVKWTVERVREPFLALMAQGSDAPFQAPLNQIPLGMESFSESVSGEAPLPAGESGRARFATLDLSAAMEKLARTAEKNTPSGLARITLTGLKDGREKAWASRLVLATDLGLLVKRGALGNVDCFVHSLSGESPLEGVKVSLLGANGSPVVSGPTNERGHIAFELPKGLKRESRPVAAVAEREGQLAWLPLEDRQRELDYSAFKTGGAHVFNDGINACLFSQRGIYRPGDILHFGCIARRGDFSLLPSDMPLRAEIMDPRGIKIWETQFKNGEFGLAELKWQSQPEALSGKYTLNVLTGKNGRNIASLSVRMEEFQPDTLKLGISVPEIRGWLRIRPDSSETIGFGLRNLYGLPAANHKIASRLETVPASFSFPGFSDYIFTDAAPFTGHGQKRNLPEIVTDGKGEASLRTQPGMLGASSARVIVSAEGFELGGGRATVAQTSFLVSPMDRILGYKPLGALTNMDFIPRNQEASVEFIALDPELEKSSPGKVDFSLAHRRYVTSLISDGNGGYRYDSTPVDQPFKSWSVHIPATGLVQKLDTDQAGEFLLTAKDEKGAILARIPYAVVGERLDPPEATLAGGKMRLRLDRTDYAAGEDINMSIAAPYDGFGLITIERDGVLAFEWFNARAGETERKIRIPAGFEGKGYVVVSFARSGESRAIYMAPNAWAVAPFSARIGERNMDLKVEAPKTIRPGCELPIKVSARERGQALVFAVDEGVLQLTDYQLPNPLAVLLSDRALDVKTLQAFDLLMPAQAQISRRIAAFGGGAGNAVFGRRFQNPFRHKNEPPLTSWSALLNVGPDPVEVKIPVPDYYNGKIRVMAVASGARGAGSAGAWTTSVAPLALKPNLPLTVAPGDVFDGGLALANTSDRKMNVKLAMNAGKNFEILKSPETRITLEAGQELAISFRLRANATPGAADVGFTASAGKDVYHRASSLSIRPASPLRASLMGGIADKSATIPVERRVYPQNASSVATLSTLPITLASGFARYLQTYPYGCAEQLVSRSFAQALLRAWPQISADEKGRQKLLGATLETLRSRLKDNGVSLWPDSEPDLLLTVYAADFLLTLREAGIGAGEDILINLCDVIEKESALNESSLGAARVRAYGIWILTRAGHITTQLLENLLDTLRERRVAGWERDLTAALIAASQKEMRMRNTQPFGQIEYSASGFFDEFAQYALHVTILARYFPEKCAADVKRNFYDAAGMAMLQNTFATFSANQGIRALLALSADIAPRMIEARIYCQDPELTDETSLIADGALQISRINRCEQYAIDMPKDSPSLFWQISTTGYDIAPADKESFHGIEISRAYLDESGQPVKKVREGDLVTVRITARAQSANIPDCVITDLLPGGFEMALNKKTQVSGEKEKVKYLDRQEDRLLLFVDLTNQPFTFEYKIRAINGGMFAIPPIAAEAMYNQAQYGHGAAGGIEIAR